MSIQVYRSSFPIIKWDLNDDDFALTKATWAWSDRTSELPEQGTPGQAIEWMAPSGYEEPTRDGFEFAGWSTDKSAPAGGFLNAEPAITMPEGAPESGEYTLYALWTPLKYSVVFELAKNPDVGTGPSGEGSFALNWSTEDGVRTVTDLGNGRYRVSGFTMTGVDYDPVRRTITLPEPARTGYRFLGWAEDADASSLVVDGPDGTFELNPVRLPQINGTPVLTARWTSAFGVTAPLSITFGDYDKIGVPDNPSMGEEDVRVADDTVQSEADDTVTPGLSDQERYEKLGQAYFENTGWNDPIKMVAITSERDANARDVLTTYDSRKATEAAVLGDGTVTNPGERLLSLYPSATEPSDKSTGVHFRLTDRLVEDDLSVLPSLPPSTPGSEHKQPVTYGLNLANDPVTGNENHGLVLDTNDYEPKQIATVSYTFAVADAASEEPYLHCTATGTTNDDIYIEYGGNVYGATDILHAADCISDFGTASPCYGLYRSFMMSGMDSQDATAAHGYVRWGSGQSYPIRIIGLAYDDKADGSGKAGLTFQFNNLLPNTYQLNPVASLDGGWGVSQLRANMNPDGGWDGTSNVAPSYGTDTNAIWNQVPVSLRSIITTVSKRYRTTSSFTAPVSASADKLFLLSYMEIVNDTLASSWSDAKYRTFFEAERPVGASGAYDFYRTYNINGDTTYPILQKRLGANGTYTNYWERGIYPAEPNRDWWMLTNKYGQPSHGSEVSAPTQYYGVAPCFCL